LNPKQRSAIIIGYNVMIKKNMVIWVFSLLSMGSMGITGSVQAQLNIDITQGIAGEIPIAVTAFEGAPPNTALSAIIKNDLSISGRFKTLSGIGPTGSVMSSTAQWQALGIENVVLGQVQPEGNNQYTIHVQLVDTFQGADKGHTIVKKTYEHIPAQQFRALGHHISDLIYETLTGVRGVFSTRIAYILVNHTQAYPYALEISDADGYNSRTLVRSKEPMMSPAWSPDGKRLAFVSFEKKQSEIYIIDVASGRRELLARFAGINGAPSWSPDGRSVALVLSKDGSPKIYIMDLLTKQLKSVTRGMNIDTEPTFEPDGRSLLFTSNRGGQPQIYRVYLNTGSVERVTFKGNYNARPRITPDGKKMVMIHQDSNGRFCIATQHLQSGEVVILTQSELDDSPSLAPNGTMVLYGTSDTKKSRRVLGMVTMDGRGRLRLPARQGDVQEPGWSPYLGPRA